MKFDIYFLGLPWGIFCFDRRGIFAPCFKGRVSQAQPGSFHGNVKLDIWFLKINKLVYDYLKTESEMSKVNILSTIIQFPCHIFAKIIIYSTYCQKPLRRRQSFFDLFETLRTLFKNPLWVFNIINMVYTIYVPTIRDKSSWHTCLKWVLLSII